MKEKIQFLDYEKIKETVNMEKTCSKQEILEVKKFYEELDEEEHEVIDVTDTLPAKIYTQSILKM